MSFRDHLVTEFSVENILFWDATRDFEKNEANLTDDECARVALRLYQDFLASGAPYEVRPALLLDWHHLLRRRVIHWDSFENYVACQLRPFSDQTSHQLSTPISNPVCVMVFTSRHQNRLF